MSYHLPTGCCSLNFWLQELLMSGPSIFYIYCKAKKCANELAKMGLQQQCFLQVYDLCPNFVCPAFVWDMKQLGSWD